MDLFLNKIVTKCFYFFWFGESLAEKSINGCYIFEMSIKKKSSNQKKLTKFYLRLLMELINHITRGSSNQVKKWISKKPIMNKKSDLSDHDKCLQEGGVWVVQNL